MLHRFLLAVAEACASLGEKEKILFSISQLFQQRKDIFFVGGRIWNGFRGISSEMVLCCLVGLPKGFCLVRGGDDLIHILNCNSWWPHAPVQTAALANLVRYHPKPFPLKLDLQLLAPVCLRKHNLIHFSPVFSQALVFFSAHFLLLGY